MGDVNEYRQILRQLILDYADQKPSVGEIQIEAVIDEPNDHYELMYSGWTGDYRVHGSVVHLDLRDGKVWIQFDGTEDGVASELVRRGIPKDRIVLAFKHPELRRHTGYAVS